MKKIILSTIVLLAIGVAAKAKVTSKKYSLEGLKLKQEIAELQDIYHKTLHTNLCDMNMSTRNNHRNFSKGFLF